MGAPKHNPHLSAGTEGVHVELYMYFPREREETMPPAPRRDGGLPLKKDGTPTTDEDIDDIGKRLRSLAYAIAGDDADAGRHTSGERLCEMIADAVEAPLGAMVACKDVLASCYADFIALHATWSAFVGEMGAAGNGLFLDVRTAEDGRTQFALMALQVERLTPIGRPVVLHGLQGRPELNSRIGMIAGEWDSNISRAPVAMVDDSGQDTLLRVKIANMRPVPGSKQEQQQQVEAGRARAELLKRSQRRDACADAVPEAVPMPSNSCLNCLQAIGGQTALHAHVLAGDAAGAQALLDAHVDSDSMRELLNAPRGDGATPLLLAAARADWPMVRLLLRAKADPTILASGWGWDLAPLACGVDYTDDALRSRRCAASALLVALNVAFRPLMSTLPGGDLSNARTQGRRASALARALEGHQILRALLFCGGSCHQLTDDECQEEVNELVLLAVPRVELVLLDPDTDGEVSMGELSMGCAWRARCDERYHPGV